MSPLHAVAMNHLTEDYLAAISITHWRGCAGHHQDAKSWKATDEGKGQRQRMKALQLGIDYGMGMRSLPEVSTAIH